MLFVANRRHHDQIARASRRDVQQSNRLLLVALMLSRLILLQLARRASREFHRRQLRRRLDIARRVLARFVAGDIGQDDDRKLEALRAMHRHDPDALGPFLDDRRLAGLVAFGARFELVDERRETTWSRRALRSAAPGP